MQEFQKMQLRNVKQRKQTTLRLPPNLYKQIEVEAKRQGISINAFTVSLFNNYVSQYQWFHDDSQRIQHV